MQNWRSIGRHVGAWGRAAWRAVTTVIGLDEVALLTGLVLVAIGLWDVWRPGAFLTPGVLLIWMTLPTRRAFVERRAMGVPMDKARLSSRKDEA